MKELEYDFEPITMREADDFKHSATRSALMFLAQAQDRELVGKATFPVDIPDSASVEVYWFKGKEREFAMAMWTVPKGEQLFLLRPPYNYADPDTRMCPMCRQKLEEGESHFRTNEDTQCESTFDD